MKRFIPVLVVILIIQVVLAVSIHVFNGEKETVPISLVNIESDAIDRIIISDDKKKEVQLKKQEGIWVVENYFNSAADSTKIIEDLENIAQLKIRLPVATTSSAADRFHVGKDTFKRKIILQQGEDIKVTVYLGDATGVHGSYARLDMQTAVYQTSLKFFDFPTDLDQWIDPHQLKIVKENISSIQLNDVTVKREKEDFVLDGADREKTDAGKVEELVKSVSDPVLDGILGTEEVASYNLSTPALTVTIGKKDKTTVTYRFGKVEKENYYALKPSSNQFYFKIAEWQVDNLLKIKRATLVKVDKKSEVETKGGAITNPDS